MKRLFIANRGEIAVRIIRAAHALGIETVQAASAADTSMLACKLATSVAQVGPAKAAKSYLDFDNVLRAAEEAGCDAIHPGYGFLSERADFAQAVIDRGIAFVGPAPATIRIMGDKAAAREAAAKAAVPTVPGTKGKVANAEEASREAKEIGFPVLIKAAAGGGGRGIRIARSKQEFSDLYTQAAREAEAAFGDGSLYLERFIERARHVEVQVLGDGENVVHLYERDCSVQRRRQKVWEEAPACALSNDVRLKLCESAVRLAKAVAYRGAGTVEYLYDDSTGEFFFIEMNTRIQVEHPITEMITGVDIVREMLRIASGHGLSLKQSDVAVRGHAIEVRINAEDPRLAFAPSPGRIDALFVPGGPGVRFDSMLYAGYEVPPFYDSLLGKLIVWDETRQAALSRLSQALDELVIKGVATTAALHRALVRSSDIENCSLHTEWLEQWIKSAPMAEPSC